MTADDRLQELIGLAHAAAQPQLTEPALRERFGRPDGWPLRAGAVWRARWDDVALLVLLVGNPTATTVGRDAGDLRRHRSGRGHASRGFP